MWTGCVLEEVPIGFAGGGDGGSGVIKVPH